MHTLKFIYSTHWQGASSEQYKDALTHCASIELYTAHGVESYQTSATTLEFDCSRDLTLGLLALSANTAYSLVVI